MATALSVRQEKKDNTLTVFIAGDIDENSKFGDVNCQGMGSVVFDFEGVSLINSLGIQAWIAFLKTVPKSVKVGFQNCALRVVNQLNIFPAFTADHDVDISSFYAPYHCAACDESYTQKLETKKAFPDRANLSAPEANCPKCKAPMEFGAVEQKYFLFLKRTKAAA